MANHVWRMQCVSVVPAMLAGTILGVCPQMVSGQPARTTPPESMTQPAEEPTASATPVLDKYKALAIRRRSLDMAVLGCVDDAPRLKVLPNAGADITQARLDAAILEAGPIVLELIELSPLTIEPVPYMIEDDPALEPYSRMPSSWFRNFCQMLRTDAKRCWRDGDAPGAMERLHAALRISTQMQEQSITRHEGFAALEETFKILVSMMDDGMEPRMDRETFDAMKAIARSVDATDLVGSKRFFELEARERLSGARAAAGSPPSASGLAAYFAREGTDHVAARARYTEMKRQGHEVHDIDRLMLQAIPDSAAADAIARMSDAGIAAAFEAAEEMIAPTASAMRDDDMEAVRAIVAAAQDDPTQLQRLVVGLAELELVTTRTVTDRWLALMERLNKVE
jgi:hypothetical protein